LPLAPYNKSASPPTAIGKVTFGFISNSKNNAAAILEHANQLVVDVEKESKTAKNRGAKGRQAAVVPPGQDDRASAVNGDSHQQSRESRVAEAHQQGVAPEERNHGE
jgi:hypothetical protein